MTELNKKEAEKLTYFWSLLSGIEAIKSGTTCVLDMFEEMRFAALLQKVKNNDASVISGSDVYKMATAESALVCQINAGIIDEGKLADLILINLNQAHLIPTHGIINTLIYCARANDVETVIINGKIVMRERIIKTIDEDDVLNEVAAMRKHFE